MEEPDLYEEEMNETKSYEEKPKWYYPPRTGFIKYVLYILLGWSSLVYVLSAAQICSNLTYVLELDWLLHCVLFQRLDILFSAAGVKAVLQAIGLSCVIFVWILGKNEEEECGIPLNNILNNYERQFFGSFNCYYVACALGIYFSNTDVVFSARCSLVAVSIGLIYLFSTCRWLVFDLEKRKRVAYSFAYDHYKKSEHFFALATYTAKQNQLDRPIYAERLVPIWKRVLSADNVPYSRLRVSFEVWKRLLHQDSDWYSRVHAAQEVFQHSKPQAGTDLYIGLGFIMFLYSYEPFRKNATDRFRYFYDVFLGNRDEGAKLEASAQLMLLFYIGYQRCTGNAELRETLGNAEEQKSYAHMLDTTEITSDVWENFKEHADKLVTSFEINEDASLAETYSQLIRDKTDLILNMRSIVQHQVVKS